MASQTGLGDIEQIIARLTLEEKVGLTSGADIWSTLRINRDGVDIPSITLSDGPHGVRGTKFFNGPRACLLPSATAMGATFDMGLLHRVGGLLAEEAKSRRVHVLLAPTLCLQRPPLLGRGFEAFGEDPVLSGSLASAYINGLQEKGIAAAIKHYAAHDQSHMSIADSIRMSERTLREVHLMPFQIAAGKSRPWAVMAAYHKINGLHASEHPGIIDILRKDWKWDGLVMSDWAGTYSTAEAILAGLDLEMPGPTKWRGELLTWLALSRKVPMTVLDERVRNVLNLVKKVAAAGPALDVGENDTEESRSLCRQVAVDSIVILKNDSKILPLDKKSNLKYGLIGDHFMIPAVCGGGSADLQPYYISTPYDAVVGVVGRDKVQYEPGCYSYRFSPLLSTELTITNSTQHGLVLEWFAENPENSPSAVFLASITTTQTYMFFSDSLPQGLPKEWFLRVRTTYTAKKTAKFRFGLCVSGIAKLLIDGTEVIDLWTSQPEKTDDTPMFNSASMERFADIDCEKDKQYELVILMSNFAIGLTHGAVGAGGLRLGVYELLNEDKALSDAVALASAVDIPIIITGLSSDWEYEGCDRKTLKLPGRIDELIEKVAKANPHTIVVTQSGCPISMPWIKQTATLAHAWFGGQETGHAIADVLFGNSNPSGRLSITFPMRLEDTPAFLTYGKADREIYYGEGVFLGYRYYEKLDRPPLFYFGHGLSYTTFEYSNLIVSDEFDTKKGHILISLHLTNIGERDGAEVVQVYISDPKSSVGRPRKELKAFKKVHLAVGQGETIDFELDKYALSFWSEEFSQWVAEEGLFEVIISTSANPDDEVLRASFRLSTTFKWSGA